VRKIGIFGGTFNPIHFGHLRVALECKQALSLDEMRMMICSQPPHREHPGVTALQRKAMLELATAGDSDLILDTREMDRSGLSYSIDTLVSLRSDFPDDALFMVIGSDSFQSLDSWHRWEELLDYCHIVIARRPDNLSDETSPIGITLQDHFITHSKSDIKDKSGLLIPVVVSQLEISSTTIRGLIKQAKSPKYLLPDSVLHYIKENSLYLL